MSFLNKITAIEAVSALKKAGFYLARQKGSHKLFKHITGIRVTVPFHSGKVLHPKIIKEILIAIKNSQKLK